MTHTQRHSDSEVSDTQWHTHHMHTHTQWHTHTRFSFRANVINCALHYEKKTSHTQVPTVGLRTACYNVRVVTARKREVSWVTHTQWHTHNAHTQRTHTHTHTPHTHTHTHIHVQQTTPFIPGFCCLRWWDATGGILWLIPGGKCVCVFVGRVFFVFCFCVCFVFVFFFLISFQQLLNFIFLCVTNKKKKNEN